jgi:hypothetical protein
MTQHTQSTIIIILNLSLSPAEQHPFFLSNRYKYCRRRSNLAQAGVVTHQPRNTGGHAPHPPLQLVVHLAVDQLPDAVVLDGRGELLQVVALCIILIFLFYENGIISRRGSV